MKNCTICRDGTILNPSTGRTSLCTFCGGAGEVDPEAICACGRAAISRKDGKAYCGREACLLDLKRGETVSSYTPARNNGFGVWVNGQGWTETTGEDWRRDLLD